MAMNEATSLGGVRVLYNLALEERPDEMRDCAARLPTANRLQSASDEATWPAGESGVCPGPALPLVPAVALK